MHSRASTRSFRVGRPTDAASSTTLFTLAVRALQQPGAAGTLARQVQDALNPPKRRRAPRTRSRARRATATAQPVDDLLDALGLRDVLDTVVAFDPAAHAGIAQDTLPKREKKSHFWKYS